MSTSFTESEFESSFEQSWEEIDENGDEYVSEKEVTRALQLANLKLPSYQIRDLLNNLKTEGKLQNDGKIPKGVFKEICREHSCQTTKDWKTKALGEDEAHIHKSEHGYSYHVITKEEQRSFSQWINENMMKFKQVSHLLPLSPDGSDLYDAIKDGILLCLLINFAEKDRIDERTINVKSKLSLFEKLENLNLAITSARAMGCSIVSTDAAVLHKGKEHLVLGMIWQLIKKFLFKGINLQNVPGLLALIGEGENPEELLKMSPEQILLRWVNYQLEKAGIEKRVNNFSNDIKDSEAYSHLIKQIAPKAYGVNTSALNESNLTERARGMLDQAEKIGCRAFVTPDDVVNGQEKLNLAFVANLFNNFPNLEDPENTDDLDQFIEDREEKMYRNWMNSLGVDPVVNYLMTDLRSGLILFQLYEFIQPGIVDWSKVVSSLSKLIPKQRLQILQNCQYAVQLGKDLGCILVGIDGNDIATGNRTLTLALVWQLMRKYTFSLLTKLSPDGKPIEDKEILAWVNQKLQQGGKSSITSFQDKSIRTAKPVLDLIECMKPHTINDAFVMIGDKLSDADCMKNANLAVSSARKIGAPVYALPEDLVEVKHKMVMTVFASLMLVDMES